MTSLTVALISLFMLSEPPRESPFPAQGVSKAPTIGMSSRLKVFRPAPPVPLDPVVPKEPPRTKKTPGRAYFTLHGDLVGYGDTTLAGVGATLKVRQTPHFALEFSGSLLQDLDGGRRDFRLETAFSLYLFEDPRSFMNLFVKGAFINNFISLPADTLTSSPDQMQLGFGLSVGTDYRLGRFVSANLEAGYSWLYRTDYSEESSGILGNQQGFFVRIGFAFTFGFTTTEIVGPPLEQAAAVH